MDILDIMMAKKLAGGGGSGEDNAVKYTSQTLTESQQMQARENLGLYYIEGQKNVIEWDGNVTDKSQVVAGMGEQTMPMPFYKVSSNTPSKSDMINATYSGVCAGNDMQGTISNEALSTSDDDCYSVFDALYGDLAYIGSMGKHSIPGIDGGYIELPEDGIYLVNQTGGVFISVLEYGNETVHKIEEKYLPEATATKEYVDSAIGNAIGGEY